MSNSKTFTCIGSRGTPKEINQLLEDICYELFRLGFIGVSGGCDEGPDNSLTNALIRAIEDFGIKGVLMAEIYIPWRKARKLTHGELGEAVINAQYLDNYPEARWIAEKIHPAWDKMQDSGRDLHSRNPYQILRHDLESPTGMVITYCPKTKSGNYKGGTATALTLAEAWFVPVVNAYLPNDLKRLRDMLEKLRDAKGVYSIKKK